MLTPPPSTHVPPLPHVSATVTAPHVAPAVPALGATPKPINIIKPPVTVHPQPAAPAHAAAPHPLLLPGALLAGAFVLGAPVIALAAVGTLFLPSGQPKGA